MARRSILTRFGVDPIDKNMRIVNPDGTATDAFLRNWLGQRSKNVTTAEDIDSAIALVNALAAKQITTTTPITGGGPLGGTIVPIGLADTAVTPGTYGDATNVPQITVDQKGRITAVVDVPITGGGGGGGASFFKGATGDVPQASATAQATKGLPFTPTAPLVIDAAWAHIDPAGAGQNHYMQISSCNPATGQITTVLATSATVAVPGTDLLAVRFAFASPVNLAVGTTYMISVTNASGIGTTAMRVSGASFNADDAWTINAPGTTVLLACSYATVGLSNGQAVSASVGGYYAVFLEGQVAFPMAGAAPYWPVAPSPPTLAGTGLTALQSTAGNGTIVDTTRGMYASVTSVAGSLDRIIYGRRAVPNGAGNPFTMRALFQPNLNQAIFRSWGLFVNDNGTGRYYNIGAGILNVGRTPALRPMRYSAAGAYSASPGDAENRSFTDMGPVWMELRLTASNLELWTSKDGENFNLAWTEAKATWVASVTHCGFFLTTNSPTASQVDGVHVMSFSAV